MLVDRDTGLDTAIRTSFQAVLANPGPMALWGLIVAGGLAGGNGAGVCRPDGGGAGARSCNLAFVSQTCCIRLTVC